MTTRVGLLALQGDYARHQEAFAALGCATQTVRRASELADCSHLVIPGGESTTLVRLIDRVGLRQALCDFAGERPVMGTCAGLILLARELVKEAPERHGVTPLGLLDCAVQRNGFGRQIDSFTEGLALDVLDDTGEDFAAVYIRAPRISAVGDEVDVIARRQGEPVMLRQGHLLAMTFHPELTADLRIHRAFLRLGEGAR